MLAAGICTTYSARMRCSPPYHVGCCALPRTREARWTSLMVSACCNYILFQLYVQKQLLNQPPHIEGAREQLTRHCVELTRLTSPPRLCFLSRQRINWPFYPTPTILPGIRVAGAEIWGEEGWGRSGEQPALLIQALPSLLFKFIHTLAHFSRTASMLQTLHTDTDVSPSCALLLPPPPTSPQRARSRVAHPMSLTLMP